MSAPFISLSNVNVNLTSRGAPGYELDGLGSIPGRNKIFVSTPQRTDRLRFRAVSDAMHTWGWLEGEADHSPPSSAEVNRG